MEEVTRLAPVAVSALIAFLAYGSQILFFYIEPHPLDQGQAITFNTLVLCLWICYARSCLVDPGRVPPGWTPKDTDEGSSTSRAKSLQRSRWCKKCECFKATRAHHCKTCKRCVPKMDHHCPWTVNCVSYRTFPHFMRFLFYATMSMGYLEQFLYTRGARVWHNRKLPSYLGPSVTQLVFLFVFAVVNSFTCLIVGIMFLRSLWNLGSNITTIESWEIDRHDVLLRRAKYFGGYLDGPNGTKIRVEKQEFPYDIGIWSNIVQGMVGGPLTWFWPFATTPSGKKGLDFEVNGFEDRSVTWPPPDPDRLIKRPLPSIPAFTYASQSETDSERIKAFRERQTADLERLRSKERVYKRRPFSERFEDDSPVSKSSNVMSATDEGEEAWRNSEGERLEDFGVDEDVEFYDEDEVPLAQLIQQKQIDDDE